MQAFVTSIQTLGDAVSGPVSVAETVIDDLKPIVNTIEGTPLLHVHCQSHVSDLHSIVLLPLRTRQSRILLFDMHFPKYVGMLLQDFWSH